MNDNEIFLPYDDGEIQQTAWRIDNDELADWAVCKIGEEKAEYDRLEALGQAQIKKITEQLASAQKRYENATSYLTAKLAEYFETVPHKETKTQQSYRLLSGTLIKKLGGRAMKANNEALMSYLKAAGRSDMIQTTEKPLWGEFKKTLVISGNMVVDTTTGDIVEGVEVVDNPDTFQIKF